MKADTKRLLRKWGAAALGIGIASLLFEGVRIDSFVSLAAASVVVTAFAVFVKPLILRLALPFIVLTLGLGVWLLNAVFFSLSAAIVNGFTVGSFWYALGGAFIVSFVSGIAGLLSGETLQLQMNANGWNGGPLGGRSANASQTRPRRRIANDDDVIDI